MRIKQTGINKIALGIDFGDVIIQLQGQPGISFYEESYLECRPVLGAFSSIKSLRRKFGKNIFIISKCTKAQEIKVTRWLKKRKFFPATGIPIDHLLFCRQRKEKAEIADRLGITHFVDDKVEVLRHMKSMSNVYLFGKQIERKQNVMPRTIFLRTRTWKKLVDTIEKAS